MYDFIHFLLCKLVDFLIGLPNSTFVRSIFAWVPAIIYYVLPLLFVISALNSFRVRKAELNTNWLKFIQILFCVDGFFYTVYVYSFPDTKYPLIISVLEVIIAIVLLIILLANCEKKYGSAVRLYVDSFFIGYGFGLFTNLCMAIWGWGVEAVWLRVLAVIIFVIVTIKTLLL